MQRSDAISSEAARTCACESISSASVNAYNHHSKSLLNHKHTAQATTKIPNTPAPVPAPQTVMTPLGEASADAGAVPAGTSASDELLITRLRRLVTMKQTRLKVRTCTLLHAPRPFKRTLWWMLLGGRLGDAGLGPWACSGVCGGGLGLIFALSSSSAAPAAFADPGPPVR